MKLQDIDFTYLEGYENNTYAIYTDGLTIKVALQMTTNNKVSIVLDNNLLQRYLEYDNYLYIPKVDSNSIESMSQNSASLDSNSFRIIPLVDYAVYDCNTKLFISDVHCSLKIVDVITNQFLMDFPEKSVFKSEFINLLYNYFIR